jgi:hypothetical protein
MASIHSTYISAVYGNLRYRPTWLPGTPTRLGDVGTLDDGIFRPVTSLANLGIAFSVTTDEVPDKSLDLTSATGSSVDFKLEGTTSERFKALAAGEAGAAVAFEGDRSALLQLAGARIHRIADQPQLHCDLLAAIDGDDPAKRWQRDWVVITEVVDAATGTIIIANGAGAKMELRAAGTMASGSLADADARFSVATKSQVGFELIAAAGLTALYRAIRVRRNFWWLYDEVQPATAAGPDPDEVFEEAAPAESDGGGADKVG